MKLMSERDGKEIERIIQLMRTDKSVDAPADAIRWSKNIFRSRVVEPKASIAQKILAVLKINLSPHRAAFGERSGASPIGQMLFQAGSISLDLRIKKGAKKIDLQGQILGAGFENCSVKVFNDRENFETRANELSEFKLKNMPFGAYTLILRNDETEIVVEDLNLS